MSKEVIIKNLKRDYFEDMKYFYGEGGRVKKGFAGSSSVRCIEPIDAIKREYANESPITKAWCGETEFKQKVKEAKAFKKVYNKKAMELAKKLLNK